MNIKTLTIEGHCEDIKISRIATGAMVSVERHTPNNDKIDHFFTVIRRNEPTDARYATALAVSRLVYGADSRGRNVATNSMIHEVMNAIELVARR